MLAFCALDHVELHAISTEASLVTVWSGFNFQEKNPWGHLAPKFSDLVTSKSISISEKHGKLVASGDPPHQAVMALLYSFPDIWVEPITFSWLVQMLYHVTELHNMILHEQFYSSLAMLQVPIIAL